MNPQSITTNPSSTMIDGWGRHITYLRLSVTDRCDFRCLYCMKENMSFLSRSQLLTVEEMHKLCEVFIQNGVRKIRITGGEPLVRKDIHQLFEKLAPYVKNKTLHELTLTTNASQLARSAKHLYACGVRRINVSLDTLNHDLFTTISRRGRLEQVLEGIYKALALGFKIKINTVALKNLNQHEIPDIMAWCHQHAMDMTLIETMPMGDTGIARTAHYLPLSEVRGRLEKDYTLEETPHRTSGPARYVKVKETGGLLGFITPLTNNFCAGCNRVRITCAGKLYLCLGQEDMVDLRTPLKSGASNLQLRTIIHEAMTHKPKGHNFVINENASMQRHMSVTGG